MSYQTSIHFDPTHLLMIKNEVDNSIQLVESAVGSLVEDQTLPFGIDDALNQIEQCADVLKLINIPTLALITEYSAELIRKIMQNPENTSPEKAIALTEGTTMLKRYIEFICLREVSIPHFLLDTLNQLELALDKPITTEGKHLEKYLDTPITDLKEPQIDPLEKTEYLHKLYKVCLNHILNQNETELEITALKRISQYLFSLSQNTPSHLYWHLIYIAFEQFENSILNQPRLRTLIEIESQIAHFLTSPEEFIPERSTIANVISLCIGQESKQARILREKLNIGEENLTDLQLEQLAKQLYGPDHQTIHDICELITQELNLISRDLEFNFQNLKEEKIEELKASLLNVANVYSVLNTEHIAADLAQKSELFSKQNLIENESFTPQLIHSMSKAINAAAILERQYTSNRLKIKINNANISLDQLDEAYSVLFKETKQLIDITEKQLVDFLDTQQNSLLIQVPTQLDEIAGAVLFMNVPDLHRAFSEASKFLNRYLQKNTDLSSNHIENLLDILASADMLVDNLLNKQPVLTAMIDVALVSSQKLKAIH
ncbi:chemotaxis protein [Acinetobacter stercoris]|uniref:Chemotaxis protein n=1 Tax=Acinetobacter stercoris TaxID=2126983 RepID=A0A2U3MVE5_9GAMM|nr:chemotaxis protein [Acinetobacter stercoris]SPL69386.1 hypothetical protein KPC_0564 [Acinetobacter stercoris]